ADHVERAADRAEDLVRLQDRSSRYRPGHRYDSYSELSSVFKRYFSQSPSECWFFGGVRKRDPALQIRARVWSVPVVVPRTTRAVVQTAPRQLEVRELPIPDIDDDSGLLRVEACGICGSDAEQYAGVIPVRFPLIPGHEPLGVIARIG